MRKYNTLFLLALPFAAFALEGKTDSSGDWQYVCDNTGTCRIAGYQSMDDLQAISLLFTREAGPDAATMVEIALLPENEVAIPEKVTLDIGGKAHELAIDKESGRGKLDEKAMKAVIEALRDQGDKAEIRVRGGDLQWQLSVKDAATMWLGAESFQKRIGTPSSWMSPGDRTDGLLEAAAKPVIKAAPVSAEAAQVVKPGEADYDRLRALLVEADRAAMTADDAACSLFDAEDVKTMGMEGSDALNILVHKLDGQHKLLSAPCDMAAYNMTEVFAWTDTEMGKVLGSLRVFTGGEGYEKGVIHEYAAGRGAGDCAFYGRHVWTGEAFVPAFAAETGLCRGFPGGAWELPMRVSEVVAP